MRYTLTTGLLVTALAIAGSAVASAQKKPAAPAKAEASAPATHAVRGVVKSVDATSLVITRSGHKGQLLSFTLNPATAREGTVDVGSTVAVRYRSEGKTLMATAVAAQPAPVVHASHMPKTK